MTKQLFGLRVPRTGSTTLMHMCRILGIGGMVDNHYSFEELKKAHASSNPNAFVARRLTIFSGIRHPATWLHSIWKNLKHNKTMPYEDPKILKGGWHHIYRMLWTVNDDTNSFSEFIRLVYRISPEPIMTVIGRLYDAPLAPVDYMIRCERGKDDLLRMLRSEEIDHEPDKLLDVVGVMNASAPVEPKDMLTNRDINFIWEREYAYFGIFDYEGNPPVSMDCDFIFSAEGVS